VSCETYCLDVAGRPRLHQVLIWYNMVAVSAAGSLSDKQRFLAVGSRPGRQCHSCCEQTCLRVAVPLPLDFRRPEQRWADVSRVLHDMLMFGMTLLWCLRLIAAAQARRGKHGVWAWPCVLEPLASM
jgi:hypothetical protein